MYGCLQVQHDGSLDNLKLLIVVRGDLHKKEIIGDNWYSTASTGNIKYLLEDYSKNKSGVHQLDFIGFGH